MEQLNDYFINLLYNPTFLAGDFKNVGLNTENTSIQDKSVYKKLDIVLDNDLFKTDGKFDELKFDLFYNKALLGYNLLSGKDHAERLATSYSAFRTDIFAKSSENKSTGPETFITKIANPEGRSLGFVNRNIMGVLKFSARENAEAHLLWDGATNSWTEAPNDTSLDNFINPKVLALYDEDVDINGKTRGEVGFDAKNIKYHKGDKKINPITGTYYYESLNGRSIYGRDVLSGWDTLTVDGSTFNRYDFFDSDDIDKSDTGSLLKSVVKVAPALISNISPWYIAARLTLSAGDLVAKIGKMLPGISSENSTLSYLEGLNAAWTLSSSDLASLHTWKLENILNLGADVFTLLAEQRWIYKYAGTLRNGELAHSKAAQEKFVKDLEQKYYVKFGEALKDKNDIFNLGAMAHYEAQAALEKKLKSTAKLSEHLSKLYMTGITVSDSYAEAKQSGLSDAEAAIFTLVYGLGEYGILSTNLGEHILPELRADKIRWLNIAKTLWGFKEEAGKDTTKFYKKIIDFAKQTVKGDLNYSKIAAAYKKGNSKMAFALSMASNALGEGLEEVSEEALLDLTKGLYNAAANLHLTTTGATFQREGGLEEMVNRYALNFVGGLIGGGIAVGLPGFLEGVKNMLGYNMDTKLAYQEAVALIRNGKLDDFLKTAKKLELEDSKLSAKDYEIVDGNKQVYKLGTETDNLNKAAHDILEAQMRLISDALSVNGVAIDDDSIMRLLTEDARKLIQFHRVLGGDKVGSSILASYSLDFNALATQIADVAIKLDALKNPSVDLEGKRAEITEENLLEISALSTKLNKLLEQRDMYLNGEMTKYALPATIFEMSDYVSAPYLATNFLRYVESVEGKPIDELTPERVLELKELWRWYKETQLSDDIRTAHGYFQEIQKRFSNHLKEFVEILTKELNALGGLGTVFLLTELGILNTLGGLAEDIQQNVLDYEINPIDNSVQPHSVINGTIKVVRSLVTALLGLNPEDKTLKAMQDRLNFLNLPPKVENLTEELKKVVSDIIKSTSGLDIELTDDVLTRYKDLFFKEALQALFIKEDGTYRTEILDIIDSLPYMNLSVKDFLTKNLLRLTNILALDEYWVDDLDDFESFLNTVSLHINNLTTTPIELLADKFLLAIGDKALNMSKLIRYLLDLMRMSANTLNIGEFGYSEDIEKQIENALQVLSLLEAHVLASRGDGGSIGNLFGYNYVLNLLIPEYDLAMIDKDTANVIMLDISKLRTKLLYYQGIFKVNSGLKLLEHSRINIRLKHAFVLRLRVFVDELPDDWNKLDESGKLVLDSLKAVLDSAETFRQIAENSDSSRFSLNQEDTKKIEKEYLDISNAIYDLFNLKDNKLRIDNGGLDSILSHLVLLPSTTDESKTFDGTNVDGSLESIDDRSFLWMLVSSGSVKTSDFYAEYINSISDIYAPIPALELAIKMTYSFLLNKPMFTAFAKAYNDKLLKELENVNSDAIKDKYGKSVIKDSKLDNDYAVLMLNTFLVEGIPGAGKSTGYYYVLIDMLKQNHSEFLNKVWVIHTDSNKALKFAEKIGLDPTKVVAMDKVGYLTKISSAYQAPLTKDGVIQLKLDDLEEDKETGIYHYKDETLNESIEIPSLIIMDESTRFSQLDFLLSLKFLEKHSVSALATGDYDLLGAVGSTKIDRETILFFGTSADNFIHCPKLGTSMRTDNKLKDINIYNLRNGKLLVINNLRNGQTPNVIELNYYEDENGIWGEKVVLTLLEAEIRHLLDTLGNDSDGNPELLLYIYLDENSDLFKILTALKLEEAYKDKLVIKNSSDAQGDEAKYTILDLKPLNIDKEDDSNINNHQMVFNSLYTGITRSTQGTIIIRNGNTDSIIRTTRVSELVKSPLSKLAIVLYANNRKEILLGLLTGDEKKTTITGKVPVNPNPSPSGGGNTTENQGSSVTVTLGRSSSLTDAKRLNNDKIDQILNGKDGSYNMLLHSMPISETGFEKDENGKWIVPETAPKERIDGLNGLIKLSEYREAVPGLELAADGKHLANEELALDILTLLTQACLYEDEYSVIKEKFASILNLRDDVEFGINFGYMTFDKTHTTEEKAPGYRRFLRSMKERLLGVFTGGEYKNKDIATQKHGLVAHLWVVKDGNRKVVTTLPITIFTSPLTMMNTKGFEEISTIFKSFTGKLGKRMLSLKNLLSDDALFTLRLLNLPGITLDRIAIAKANGKKLLTHLNLYTSTKDEVVIFEDGWTLAGNSTPTGPNITTHCKGNEYEVFSDIYNWEGEYMNISDLDTSIHHISKNAYYVTSDVVINGKVLLKAGSGFVLCSDYYSTTSDEELIKLFINEELTTNPKGRISALYVCSPGVTVEEYFKNFAQRYRKNGNVNTDFGNYLTDIIIAQAITKDSSKFNKLMDDWFKELLLDKKLEDLSDNDVIKNRINRWKIFLLVMQKVETDLEGKTFEEKRTLLGSAMSEEYLSILKLDSHMHGTYKNRGTLKLYIQNQILLYALKPTLLDKLKFDDDGNLEISDAIRDRFEAITEDTKDTFKDGIFVNLSGTGAEASIDVETENFATSFVRVDANDKYEIDIEGVGLKPLRLNGKIDSTMHTMNVRELMDMIATEIDKRDGFHKKRYFGDWPHTKVEPSPLELLYEGLKQLYSLDSETLSILKNLCFTHFDKLIDLSNNKTTWDEVFTANNIVVHRDSNLIKLTLASGLTSLEAIHVSTDKVITYTIENGNLYKYESGNRILVSSDDITFNLDEVKSEEIKKKMQELITKDNGNSGGDNGNLELTSDNIIDKFKEVIFPSGKSLYLALIDGSWEDQDITDVSQWDDLRIYLNTDLYDTLNEEDKEFWNQVKEDFNNIKSC